MSGRKTRKPNLDSSIYYSETDGRWHGRVTMRIKNDGTATGGTPAASRRPRSRRAYGSWSSSATPASPRSLGVREKFGAWMATYLDVICENLVASGKMNSRTLDDYRSKYRNWIGPKLGGHRLDRLLSDHLDAACAEMYEAGLSPSTVLRIHRIISRALTVAICCETILRPSMGVPGRRRPNTRSHRSTIGLLGISGSR